jgi:hypothetical protein
MGASLAGCQRCKGLGRRRNRPLSLTAGGCCRGGPVGGCCFGAGVGGPGFRPVRRRRLPRRGCERRAFRPVGRLVLPRRGCDPAAHLSSPAEPSVTLWDAVPLRAARFARTASPNGEIAAIWGRGSDQEAGEGLNRVPKPMSDRADRYYRRPPPARCPLPPAGRPALAARPPRARRRAAPRSPPGRPALAARPPRARRPAAPRSPPGRPALPAPRWHNSPHPLHQVEWA